MEKLEDYNKGCIFSLGSFTYEVCLIGLTRIHKFIKNNIMNHLTRLFTFTDFCNLKFCAIAKTCFASVTVMLKKIIQIKYAIQMI